MQFCDKCGGLLVPKKTGSKTVMVCRKCGKRSAVSKGEMKITTESGKQNNRIVVVEKKANFEALPKTEIECVKCGNREAFWWMQQTRASDEPPTRFYRCTKCNHTWREYE
ncbi:MAG: transcription factor S [Candidatus Aenigmatarchaeota archaeon]